MVEWLFLAVLCGCLRFVIVVFPGHTHLLFFVMIDQFIKLVELAVLPDQNEALTAKALLCYFITPFGCQFN